MDAAAELLSSVPKEHRNKVARFLEAQGQSSSTQNTSILTPLGRPDHKELALQVTTDPDHKFDLSLLLDDLDGALEIARSVPPPEGDTKWKAIGDRALAVWRFHLARECFEHAGDLSALLLLLLAVGDRPGLEKLSAEAGKPHDI